MAERKLDLPADLLPCKVEAHGGNDEAKGHVGLLDESKDQVSSESSMPLSPQWLHVKPSETKMEIRAPTSVLLGNSIDSNQKDGRRMDGSEEKKDWRRTAAESEHSHRWREEERETGLIGVRRDHRKADRRVDNISMRETTDNRVLSASDRWHDGSSRASLHESWRDNKWSARWGPEDKEKDSRVEKKADVDKEREDTHNDIQSFAASNRSASERESDSRDKWRPRHRMEAHSGGSTSFRSEGAPGLERGRGEGSNVGFTLGRGRSSTVGRSSTLGTIGTVHSFKTGSVLGKPSSGAVTFCYPRGKLLDIYRKQKIDSSFMFMPHEMQESPCITHVDSIEPLSFVAPNAEEEVILNDIWKGKVTNTDVVCDSFKKGGSSESVRGKLGSTEEKEVTATSVLAQETMDILQEAGNDNAFLAGEKRVHLDEGKDKVNALFLVPDSNGLIPTVHAIEINRGYHTSLFSTGENWQTVDPALTKHAKVDDTESASSFDMRSKQTDDSWPLFVLPSPEQNQSGSMQELGGNGVMRKLTGGFKEELSLYYIDPQGNTQGPFSVADITLWLEEGFFATDLLVRFADAPEGTPFQELGVIMPYLMLRDGNANVTVQNSKMEISDALGGQLAASLSAASVAEKTNPSPVNDPYRPFDETNCQSSQHGPPKISEAEHLSQLPQPEGQSFHDLVIQDEEIVFPGRTGNMGYPTLKSRGRNPLENSGGHSSLPNELIEPGGSSEHENKLHPFGLLWSELEGTHTKHTQASDIPSSMARAASFEMMNDSFRLAEAWPDIYRQKAISGPHSYQDPLSSQLLSPVKHESNSFELGNHVMSQNVHQQQMQQRNMLSPQTRLNESILEQRGQNFMQLANHPTLGLEPHLILQMQQQWQLELQRHQQLWQQQKLQQERRQSQVRQVLLEQLLHGQTPDSVLGQSLVDPIRANNTLDQIVLEQQLLHELEQWSNHPSGHNVPSIEQLAQAKFGLAQQQEHQRDMLELMLRSQHGQMQEPLDHRILCQEQQARKLSMKLRQLSNMEEVRRVDSVWPTDEADIFLRTSSGTHRVHSMGMSPLDFYQQQQRLPHEEQLNHLERNLSLQDQLRQGLFVTDSLPYERSMSFPSSALGLNLDVVNALPHDGTLDVQESRAHVQSAVQMGTRSFGIHSHNAQYPLVPNQFHSSHLDASEGRWSDTESNGQLANDWVESKMQQLHINSEWQKKESEGKMTVEGSNRWMSSGFDEDKSRRLLMDLLYPKSSHQPAELLDMNDGVSSERKSPLWLSSVSDSCEPGQVCAAEKQWSSSEDNGKLLFKSESGTSVGDSFLSSIGTSAQSVGIDSNSIGKPSLNREYLEVEGAKHVAKIDRTRRDSISEIQDALTEKGRLAVTDHGRAPINALGSRPTIGLTGGGEGLYSDKIGRGNSFTEGIVKDRGQENILLGRPPFSRPSSAQEESPKLPSDPVSRGKGPSSTGDGGRREFVLNPSSQASDISSSGMDMRFQHMSYLGDPDVSEPSFIEMLKSNSKKTTTTEAYAAMVASQQLDGPQGSRIGRKKGKKGRQIDPALLGFKVTSNRIMMGEIQHMDD